MQSVICSLQSVVCSVQSAVCSLQSAVCKCQTPVCDGVCDNGRSRGGFILNSDWSISI